MYPKFVRLMFVAIVVAGFSAPMLGASAAGQPRTVDAWNPPRNFEVPNAPDSRTLEINKDDSVSWIIWEGEHTVTAKDASKWGGDGSDPDAPLKPEDPRYSKTFTKPGDYIYFCNIHGGVDEDGPFGMWGTIRVKDTTPNTQPPATTPPTTPPTSPPATTAPTSPGATPPATSATAPTTRPTPTTAAPTTTTKPDRDKKPKDPKDPKDETTTTTLEPPPPPVDLSDEAIIPTLPGLGGTSSAEPGANAEAPADTPKAKPSHCSRRGRAAVATP